MRRRNILYSPDPRRIVDMAEVVDIGGGGGELEFKRNQRVRSWTLPRY